MADGHLFISNFRVASSIDVDIVNDDIYWTDTLESKIFRAPLSGGKHQVVVSLDLISPQAIVIDWIGRKIYWADSGTGYIEVSDLDGGNRMILVKGGLAHVNALALDIQAQ